jgi:acyl-coenzyme A synthetase/AMP-(fatty) acid ligase
MLHGHPAVAEAAVVSMPHERLGEGVFAFVVAREGCAPTHQDLTVYLDTRGLARHKYPERLAVVTELPRTASGKIRKDILRARAGALVNDAPSGSAR